MSSRAEISDTNPQSTSRAPGNRLPSCLKASKRFSGFVLILGALFTLLSHQPLWHTDLWGHLQYGEIIQQQGTIPETEPIIPLAAGTPITDTAWLSQVVAFCLYSIGGVAGLQFLYALSITACFALLLLACYRQTDSVVASLGSLAVMGWLNWRQFQIIRPQLAGLICFMVLLVILSQRRWRRANWFFVSVLFVLWANLHGSFIVGIGLLACSCLGRAIDLLRRTRRIAALFHDRRARRLILLTVLAVGATLLNPYGSKLYVSVLTFSRNPNLQDLTEWGPLTIHTFQGQAVATVAVALVILFWMSPRRLSAVDILLLAGLGGAAVLTSRMIVWWAPPAAYCLARQGSAVWNRFLRRREDSTLRPRSGFWSLVSLGLMGLAVALSPLGGMMLSGKNVDFRKSVSGQTPVSAAEYLLKHPPQGQIFNTYEWGDYLSWVARQNQQDWQIFVASHAHLVPREVWLDYMAVIQLQPGWESRLDRHGVNNVIIDTRHRHALATMLRRDHHWRPEYEDDRAVIFVREQPRKMNMR